MALSMASVACDSDTPGGRLKLMVLAGVPLWWFTDSGVLVGSMRGKGRQRHLLAAGVVSR